MKKIRYAPLALLLALGCGPGRGHVDIKVSGEGRVRSDPQGLSCTSSGVDCSADLGHSFTLVAEPSLGSRFDHWEGDDECIAGSRPTITFGRAPDHALSCTAIFTTAAAQNGQ